MSLSWQVIGQLVEQFEASGSVSESASKRRVTGRPRTVPTGTLTKQTGAIASSPRLSVRLGAQGRNNMIQPIAFSGGGWAYILTSSKECTG